MKVIEDYPKNFVKAAGELAFSYLCLAGCLFVSFICFAVVFFGCCFTIVVHAPKFMQQGLLGMSFIAGMFAFIVSVFACVIGAEKVKVEVQRGMGMKKEVKEE